MKYLTTLEVARELNVTKQTLLNWLYAKKVPEPPRNRNGHRLWSQARVSLIRQLIREGRLHSAQEGAAGRVQHDAPAVPIEQPEADLLLQQPQLLAHRTVREVQLLRRGAQVLQAGEGAEGGQRVQRQAGHAVQHS